jgi:hypothetical protein
MVHTVKLFYTKQGMFGLAYRLRAIQLLGRNDIFSSDVYSTREAMRQFVQARFEMLDAVRQ